MNDINGVDSNTYDYSSNPKKNIKQACGFMQAFQEASVQASTARRKREHDNLYKDLKKEVINNNSSFTDINSIVTKLKSKEASEQRDSLIALMKAMM